jgi:hypothetical protein
MSLGTGGLPSASCVKRVMKAYEKCERKADKLKPSPDSTRSEWLEQANVLTNAYDKCAEEYQNAMFRLCIDDKT